MRRQRLRAIGALRRAARSTWRSRIRTANGLLSEVTDAPLLTNLLVSAGTALVGILETRLAPAEDEANRLRQEKAAEADGSAIAPWQTLAEQYSILEDELKIRIFAIAESDANFSAEIAAKRRRSGNILPGCLPMANAALAADDTLRALRFKFVPARLTEEEFWRCYFWHVANVKCELLHDWRTANGARREAAIEEERSLAPMVGSSSSSQQQQQLAKASGAEGLSGAEEAGGGGKEAEEEAISAEDLDAEFERLIASPT